MSELSEPAPDAQSSVTPERVAALRAALRAQGSLRLPIVSDSMAPLIRTGQRIEIRPLPTRLARYDILVFRDRQRLICHYLLHFNRLPGPAGQALLVTRSLRGQAADHPVAEADVLGIVASHRIPRAERLRIWARDWLAGWSPRD